MFPHLPNYTDRQAQRRFQHLAALKASKEPTRFAQVVQALRERLSERQHDV